MKKFFKFLGSAAVLCATVAGGIFAYKKFFAPDPFEDDFDDDLDDLEDDSADEDIAGREYVSLTSSEDDTDEEESKAESVDTLEEAEKTASEEAAE